ncbi:MAG: choice-of-anchor L domain-containing protein, partial [Bacteroidota bacterium]
MSIHTNDGPSTGRRVFDENGVLQGNGLATTGAILCLEDACHTVVLDDTFGDGWNGAIFTMSVGGVEVFNDTMVNGFTISFDVPLGGSACAPDPIGDCPSPYNFSAFGGTFDGEIAWTLDDENGVNITGGVTTTGTPICLDDGCYVLNLLDTFGDGWNGAFWTLSANDGTLIGTGTLAGGASNAVTISVNSPDCDDTMDSGTIQVQSGSLSPAQLITDVFLGECLEASNVNFTGAETAIGTFTNGSSIGIEEGIIITNGSVFNAPGPNYAAGVGVSTGEAGSTLLDGLAGDATFDASVFTFDFMASTGQVTFTYVFASEEYPEFVCGGVNDAFGFFVSGPGYAPNTNVAIVPGTTDPVTIDNVNNNGDFCPPFYPAYYVDNPGNQVQYDGYTTPLQAVVNTQPCETYTITIAIADGGDGIYDSAVFLQAESFSAGVDVSIAAVGPGGTQSNSGNCSDTGSFLFVNNGDPFDENVTLTYSIGGSAIPGVDYVPTMSNIEFAPGQSSHELDIAGLFDGLDNTPETIILELDNVCTCTPPEPVVLYVCATLLLPVEWLDFEVSKSPGSHAATCQWSTLSEQNNSHFVLERSPDSEIWEY